MKARVLAAEPWVDHSICGPAISEAITKNAIQSRHLLKLISASTGPTIIKAMKL